MTDSIEILYFYRTKWGAHDEFMRLFRKNHWPILREHLAAGRLTDVHVATPRFHGDGRADWDVIVSITYKDWAAIEAAFMGNEDPIADLREKDFTRLYQRIVALAPAPVGLGERWKAETRVS